MEASTDLFINIIRNKRIIYDKTSSDFKDSNKKEDAWKEIADESRTSVTLAKKRYLSLRQKYCRMKKNHELQRRSKLPNKSRPWIYFDRLRFLDDHISPRQTHTNDMDFEEVTNDNFEEEETLVENNEDFVSEDFVPENFDEYSEDFTPVRPTVHVPQNCQDFTPIRQAASNIICSQYSGEQLEESQLDIISDESLSSGLCIPPQTTNMLPTKPSGNSHGNFPLNQVISAPSGTSQPESIGANLTPATETVFLRPAHPISLEPRGRKELTRSVASSLENSTSASATSSRQITTGRNTSTCRSVPPSQTKSTQPASSNKDSAPTAEILRKKMDSYLTICSNKLLEKPQRSPHAPFLAYLGTKLENVPKEKIPLLEVKLLEMVSSYTQGFETLYNSV